MINNDQPKNSIKEDELGYSYLSYYFAKIIKEVETKDKAYVLGLCGKWGDGKTTIINYIKEILLYSYEKNIDLKTDNYRNVIEDIKNTNLQNNNKTSYFFNKLAIFNTCVSFILIIITFFIKFNIYQYITHIQFINKYLFFVFILFIFAIPKFRNYIFDLIKELYNWFLNLFISIIMHKGLNIEFIDFNPWNYQKDEKVIIENFFKVLANKIDIKDNAKYKNINLLLQYAICLLGLKIPNIKCDGDIADLKENICYKLKQCNKKYVVIIDDLDRIQPQEALVIFKVVKLLADFPNIIYFLAYDKEHLTSQWPLQNTNYIQKIIQLEKNVPIIPPAKLKEIFIKRMTNILENGLTESDKNELSKIYDNAISKLMKNIRDINRFENSFSLSYIANKNIKEINVFDYLLISILEEFDKKTYTLIQNNKTLLFESISALDLKKHVEFIQTISKNIGFYIFMSLFTPYLSNLEEVLNSLADNRTTTSSQYNSDVSQHEIAKNLDLFRYYYKRFVKEDNYRRICTKESFDNYFLTNIVTSLVTDIEYKEITDSISTPNDFAQVFTKIFSKNEDKFKDFCERVSRDSTIISDAKMLKNFVKSCLAIEDELLYRLFNIREFCENILSIVKIKRLFTKHEMLEILLNSFASNNVVQEIFWYDELSMSNIDEYFKTDRFKKFNVVNLKNKISESNIIDNNDFNYILTNLIKLRKCNIKISNFKDLTNKILQSDKYVIELLKSCTNSNDYKFYFEFIEIQDVLIKYYLKENGNHLGDRRFLNDIVCKILSENLKDKIQNLTSKITAILNIQNTLNTYLKQKNYEQQNNAFINIFSNFKKQNIFSVIDGISENELVIKYIVDNCIKDGSLWGKIESIINVYFTIIEGIKSVSEKINIDFDFNEIKKLEEKYTEIINELEQTNR